MTARTFRLAGGKYEIDRNNAGLMTDARRHGEPWPAGFDGMRFQKVTHAMLDRIERLEDALRDLAQHSGPFVESGTLLCSAYNSACVALAEKES